MHLRLALLILLFVMSACGPAPNHVSSPPVGQLGYPLESNGVVLTVLRVVPNDQRANGARSVSIEVAVHNREQPAITLAPATFQLVDTTGTSYPAESITDGKPPKNERVLEHQDWINTHVTFSVDGAATEQALHFTPFVGADRMEIRLVPETGPTIAVEHLDLERGVVDVAPPPGWSSEITPDILSEISFTPDSPMPEQMVGIRLEPAQPTGGIGNVFVLGYASSESPRYLYNLVAQGSDDDQHITGVGETAVLFDSPGGTFRELTFVRCQVHIILRFFGAEARHLPSDADLIAYSQRLDAELKPRVCG